jgi:hypothetical protein
MEMGVVVETSSHPINGMHGEKGRGGDCQSKAPWWMDFLCRAH